MPYCKLAVALAHHLQQSKTDTFGSARQGMVRAVRRCACGGSGRERRVRGSEECGACEATEPSGYPDAAKVLRVNATIHDKK